MCRKKKMLIAWFLLLAVTLPPVEAQEDTAQQSAEQILRELDNQDFKAVWDRDTSEWAKKNWQEDAFLANMAIGRPQLGKLQNIQIISKEHTNKDQSTGVAGDIYAMTFKNKYTTGEFYERIVVIKDSDGQYRLSGIYGSPVPRRKE